MLCKYKDMETAFQPGYKGNNIKKQRYIHYIPPVPYI